MTVGLLSQLAVEFRGFLAVGNWTDQEWRGWFFFNSPYMVSLQFGIGVVAYQVFCAADLDRWKRACSNLGATGLIAIYVLIGAYVLQGADYAIPLLTAIATGLILVGATTDTLANRLLSKRAIVYLGTISYSLYLFHFITAHFAMVARRFETFTWTAAGIQAVNLLAASALAVFVSTGIYRLVEVPGRRAIRAAADRWLDRLGPASAGQKKVAQTG